jgi:hypothetical protein
MFKFKPPLRPFREGRRGEDSGPKVRGSGKWEHECTMLKRLDPTSTRFGLTVRHRVGAIAGPTQLLVRTENNVDHLVLILASGGTVGDA